MDIFEEHDIMVVKNAYKKSKFIIIGLYVIYGIVLGIILGINDPEYTLGQSIFNSIILSMIGFYLFKHWTIEKNQYEGWKLFLVVMMLIVTFPALFLVIGIMFFYIQKSIEENIVEIQEQQEYLEKEITVMSDNLHTLRVQQLTKVFKKSKKIRLNDLSELLQVEKSDLLSWIYNLPDEYEITINGDYAEFGTSIKEKAEEIITFFEKPELNLT